MIIHLDLPIEVLDLLDIIKADIDPRDKHSQNQLILALIINGAQYYLDRQQLLLTAKPDKDLN